jgi:glycosyltransferase involved in cell wall biosynthesis
VDYYKKWTVSWFGAYDRLLCHTLRHYSVFRWHPGAVYVPWGTNTAVFRPVPRDGTGDLVFFHSAGMGGIHTRKGTDLLVRAFQTVSGPARLVIHSQVPVDRYGEAVAAAIRDNPRIEFREGSVTTPGLYCLGDVYVYPTRLDGIGLSVPEALASGLPVIATNVAPCSEFVTHGYNGWLVDVARTKYRDDGYYWPETECDVDALARAMQHCVDQRSQLPAWRMAARASAEERLCWETNARQLPGLFASWMATPPGSTPLLVRAQLALAYPSGPGIPRDVARTCRRAIRQLLTLVHRR